MPEPRSLQVAGNKGSPKAVWPGPDFSLGRSALGVMSNCSGDLPEHFPTKLQTTR